MHHVVLESWSRRSSALHAREPRVKLLATLAFLLAVATTRNLTPLVFAAYASCVLAGVLIARLPLGAFIARASLVLPFSIVFGAITWFAGDPERAASLIGRSFVSAAAVLLLVASTPLQELLRALEWLRVPRLLILVTQFLYRYLFTLLDEGQRMRMASRCRSGRGHRTQGARFSAAGGALAVLFARSYQRAEGIHHAMLARGFSGHFPVRGAPRLTSADFGYLAAALVVTAAIRIAA